MSVDLSDPEIGRVREEVLDSSNATSWFLLHYSPTATSPALALVSSGSDPILPQWLEELDKLKEAGEDVAFGYGEFKGKGCVLHYLSDRMGGVKRARAVVHSRAVASMFPEYAALVTIADPSQLTQELIDEKLGLNYHVQQVAPAHPVRTPVEEKPAALHGLEKKDNGGLPATPQGPSTPNHGEAAAPESRPGYALAPVPAGSSHPQAPQQQQQHSRQISGSGPVGDTPPDRQRKVSLTTRLGKAFGNPTMQGRSPEHSSPGGSPGSPSGTSKFKTSFSKAFRRTSADSPASSGGRADSPDAPPVPPKDHEPPMLRPAAAQHPSQTSASSSGQYRTPSGGVGYSPIVPAPRTDSLPPNPQYLQTNGTQSAGSMTPSNAATNTHTNGDTGLSPSPSAQRVFAEASAKSLTQEEEIQNRFRRDLHLDERGSGSREVVNLDDEPEEDLRLPYDVSDDRLSDHAKDEPTREGEGAQVPASLQLGQPIVAAAASASEADTVPDSPDTSRSDRPVTAPTHDEELAVRSEPPVATIVETGADYGARADLAEDGGPAGAGAEGAQAQAALSDLEREEDELREEEAARERLAEAEIARQATEAKHQQEEEARVLREAEERRAAEEAEAKRKAEQEREEEARRKEEEEEKLRIALEEQRRIEEARLAEEAMRQREEEERRVEAEKQEAERARKESIKQSLREGKRSGGVMLRGHVTVQTTKSLIWRRRHFQLYTGEMRLFKAETDDKPIQTIQLGPQTKVEHTYEESQVQGSWKITSDGLSGPEEFFVFADSPEEKETILEGIQMAIA